ncbi:MAG: hypothetical protein P1V97_35200 [Planctomycetota bacterium]|nr:hypothetical protein [Planctomycetota bacterium]
MSKNNTAIDTHQYRELKPVGVAIFLMVAGFASVMNMLSFLHIS